MLFDGDSPSERSVSIVREIDLVVGEEERVGWKSQFVQAGSVE